MESSVTLMESETVDDADVIMETPNTTTLSTDTTQLNNESIVSVQIEPVIDENNESRIESVIQPPSSPKDKISRQRDEPAEPVGKSMIADRIAFEEPIITDVQGSFKKLQGIFTEDTGPSFYTITSNLGTQPIISKLIPKQFESLPVFGAPKRKFDLPQFYYDKIREFVRDDTSDGDFEKLVKYCRYSYNILVYLKKTWPLWHLVTQLLILIMSLLLQATQLCTGASLSFLSLFVCMQF